VKGSNELATEKCCLGGFRIVIYVLFMTKRYLFVRIDLLVSITRGSFVMVSSSMGYVDVSQT